MAQMRWAGIARNTSSQGLISDVDHRAAREIVERILEAIRQVNRSVPPRLLPSAAVAISYLVDMAESLMERDYTAVYDAKTARPGLCQNCVMMGTFESSWE